ncbi:aminotransferase class I/II-fold pyridoxal phosphate-dependent enzyme [Dermacoccaceae bacterium W4C1]
MITPSRRSAVEPFHVMEVLKAGAERSRTHGDVILMCAGQPSTPAPAPVREAAVQALQTQVLGYTEATGILPLREAIAEHHTRTYGLSVSPDEVCVTTGSSGGFTALFLAAFDPGDVVVMARPGYPAYRNTLQALGIHVQELHCGPDSRYQPTVQMLESLPEPPAGLIVASPANPTGTIIPDEQLRQLAQWCQENDCLLISDEIYHGVSYGQTPRSAREFSAEAVVVGSVSKYFSMTGWRLGWMLLPPSLRRPVELLSGNLSICPPAPAQYAAVAAFSPQARTELEAHVQRYATNRSLLVERLPELGVTSYAPPDGAFYAWCDIGHLTQDSTTWCAQVLAATGVAITPGVDFDTVEGAQWIRLSFAGSTEDVSEAMSRLVAFVGD